VAAPVKANVSATNCDIGKHSRALSIMTAHNINRSFSLMLCSLIPPIALGLLLNYLEVYELIFGIQGFSLILAIPLYLSALIAGIIILGPVRVSWTILILSSIALGISLSAWTPLVRSLPDYLFILLLGVFLMAMVVKGRIKQNQT